MRILDAAINIYKSSNDELINEKSSIFLERKDNIIKSLISNLDDLEEEQEKDEEPLLIFCANCMKKHFLGKCPLSSLKVYKICEEAHSTENFLSLPGLINVLRKSSKELNQLLGITQNPSPFYTWNNVYSPELVQ